MLHYLSAITVRAHILLAVASAIVVSDFNSLSGRALSCRQVAAQEVVRSC